MKVTFLLLFIMLLSFACADQLFGQKTPWLQLGMGFWINVPLEVTDAFHGSDNGRGTIWMPQLDLRFKKLSLGLALHLGLFPQQKFDRTPIPIFKGILLTDADFKIGYSFWSHTAIYVHRKSLATEFASEKSIELPDQNMTKTQMAASPMRIFDYPLLIKEDGTLIGLSSVTRLPLGRPGFYAQGALAVLTGRLHNWAESDLDPEMPGDYLPPDLNTDFLYNTHVRKTLVSLTLGFGYRTGILNLNLSYRGDFSFQKTGPYLSNPRKQIYGWALQGFLAF